MDAREIGLRIRRLRCGRRLSQDALADFAGRTDRWLSNVEQGRATLTLGDVERLALGLRVDEAVLYGYAPMPPWLPRGAVVVGDRGVDRLRADWGLAAGGQLLEAVVECWLREELERSISGERTRPLARHRSDHRLLLVPEQVAIRLADLSARIAALVASCTPGSTPCARSGAVCVAAGRASISSAVAADREGLPCHQTAMSGRVSCLAGW